MIITIVATTDCTHFLYSMYGIYVGTWYRLTEDKRAEHHHSDHKELFCFVCSKPLKILKLESPDTYGMGKMDKEVYVCERGHTFSGEALMELHANELP